MSRAEGIAAELAFWLSEIFAAPPSWHEGELADWVARPRRRFPHWVLDYLARIEQPLVLEVGCGPLPDLEWGHTQGLLRVSASDPLWDAYRKVRERFDIRGAIAPRAGTAAESPELFPQSYFDAVLARNCLDHSADPFADVAGIHKVLRKSGVLFFEHIERCGSSCDWADLHQWDFYEEAGYLYAADQGGTVKALAPQFRVEDCWRLRRSDGPRTLTVLRAVLRREAP